MLLARMVTANIFKSYFPISRAAFHLVDSMEYKFRSFMADNLVKIVARAPSVHATVREVNLFLEEVKYVDEDLGDIKFEYTGLDAEVFKRGNEAPQIIVPIKPEPQELEGDIDIDPLPQQPPPHGPPPNDKDDDDGEDLELDLGNVVV